MYMQPLSFVNLNDGHYNSLKYFYSNILVEMKWLHSEPKIKFSININWSNTILYSMTKTKSCGTVSYKATESSVEVL